MKVPILDTSTDLAWEEWGRRDPYFGVITDPKYRRSQLNEQTKREFFELAVPYVDYVMATIRKHIHPDFAPKNILEFGCGVGRLLVPFAKLAENVVGVDVSMSMLKEARDNCDARELRNVSLFRTDDHLSTVTDTFDLIHSFIVFQHIPVARGRAIFSRLLQCLRPGGVAAIHLVYSKTRFAATYGVAPPESAGPKIATPRIPSGADPELQMNPYNMNEILFLMQCRGVQNFHVDLTDHGGELGLLLFFSVTGPAIGV